MKNLIAKKLILILLPVFINLFLPLTASGAVPEKVINNDHLANVSVSCNSAGSGLAEVCHLNNYDL